jgi:hypothetical protein
MSKAAYLADLRRRLEELETKMAADRKQLASGSPHDKVEAAGDLAFLQQQLAETKQKLSRVESRPEGAWENFKTELEEEFDHLAVAFERWAERQ